MPVRNFDYFAGDNKWTESENVAALRNMRLGVDGSYWLRRVYYSMPKEDSVVAMGGIPLGLKQAILRDLENFRKLNCELFIVFNGIPQPMRKSLPLDTRPDVRKQGWERYQQGDFNGAHRLWHSLGSVPTQDLLNSVFEILQQAGVGYMRAPYSAAAQLAYMDQSPRSFFNAVFAGNDYLLFDVDRVVTSIDFQRQAFAWINKGRVLRDLQVSAEGFLDICLVAGFDFLTTLPALDDRKNGITFSFQAAVDLTRNYQTGFQAVSAYAEHPEVKRLNYVDQFIRTRFIVKHQPVFTEDCRIEPLQADSCPSDMEELLGCRFPREIYFYLTQCLLSPFVLQTLASGVIFEQAPLDGGESQEYRALVAACSKTNQQAIASCLQLLHSSFADKPLTIQYWFEQRTIVDGKDNESAKLVIDSAALNKLLLAGASAGAWIVSETELASSLEKHSCSGQVSLQFLVKFLSDPHRSGRTIRKTPAPPMTTAEQLKFVALGRALQLRGLIDEKSRNATAYGRALQSALYSKHSRFSLRQMNEWREQHAEHLWTLLELVKCNALTNQPLSVAYDVSVDCNEHALLIIRVVSLLTPYFKGLPWTGPLSRDFLAFNSLVKSCNRSLRSLCEICAVSALLVDQQSNFEFCEPLDFSQVALELPFLKDPNTALALLFHSLLNADKQSAEDRLTAIEAQFSQWILDVRTEVDRGLALWSDSCAMMRELAASNRPDWSPPAYIRLLGKQFQDADKWLRSVMGDVFNNNNM